MAFPVNSTSVMSPVIARLNRVMQRTDIAKRLVSFAGVFACKQTAGTNLYSAHAFGKAVDYMLKVPDREAAERLALAVVRQATQRTRANRFRRVRGINFVVGGTHQWIRQSPTLFVRSPYGGVPHDNHVHAAEHGSTSVKPPCAR